MPIQSDLRFTFEAARAPAFEVIEFTLREALSETFLLTLELSSEDPAVDFDTVLDRHGLLTIWRGDRPVRYVHGVISTFTQGATGFRRTRYRAVLEPRLARLRLNANWRIFQGMTASDIVKKILKGHGVIADFQQRITEKHPVREYCVQAGDTDYDFVERIMREEGFFYTFHHEADRHELIHSDRLFIHGRLTNDADDPYIGFYEAEEAIPSEEEMAKIAKNRLEKVLPRVVDWSTDIMLTDGKWIRGYAAGTEKVVLAISDLDEFGMQAIRDGLLAASKSDLPKARQLIACGVRRIIYSKTIEILKWKGTDRNAIGDLDIFSQDMFCAIALGRPELVAPFLKVVIDGLDGGYGVRDGHRPPSDTTLRYGAFALSIICDWLGQPFDLDKYALPRDPAWGQLVAHWREPDVEKFLAIILTACDTHVERIAVTISEANTHSKKFEFGSVFLAVHPTEILAILRLRDLIGLPNPGRIDHPLMQTPYAQITCPPGAIKQRDDLLEDFLKVVRVRDPQALPSGM